jgi:Uma2 family endonuclease
LLCAVRDANAPGHVNGDGMTVEIGDSDYEPDAILYCGTRLPPGSMTVPNPVVIVEVLSPSTSATDRAWKLREYFRLPSVRHYLIIWADTEQIVHHRRNDAGALETTVLTTGEIALDPPGIAITGEEIYADWQIFSFGKVPLATARASQPHPCSTDPAAHDPARSQRRGTYTVALLRP